MLKQLEIKGLGVDVSIYFNLLRKLLYSYFHARWSLSFNLLQSFQEAYHYISQCFLHEMVQGQSDTVDAYFGLKILLEHFVL